jgi:hypothetical protein
MAYPTGSGSERLMRGTVNSLTSTTTALLFNGSNGTTKNQETNVVPTNHIITMLSMVFCNKHSSESLIKMYIECSSPTDAISLLDKQPVGIEGTFVWNDKFILQGGDKLIVYLNVAGAMDVHYTYIDQDWTTP